MHDPAKEERLKTAIIEAVLAAYKLGHARGAEPWLEHTDRDVAESVAMRKVWAELFDLVTTTIEQTEEAAWLEVEAGES